MSANVNFLKKKKKKKRVRVVVGNDILDTSQVCIFTDFCLLIFNVDSLKFQCALWELTNQMNTVASDSFTSERSTDSPAIFDETPAPSCVSD